MRLIYLASPYNDDDPNLREYRYKEACRACVWLMNRGIIVYSPIVHNHPLAVHYELPKGWDFWQHADTCVLERCDEMFMLAIDGWLESRGVRAEREFALARAIPVSILTPTEDSYTCQGDTYEQKL